MASNLWRSVCESTKDLRGSVGRGSVRRGAGVPHGPRKPRTGAGHWSEDEPELHNVPEPLTPLSADVQLTARATAGRTPSVVRAVRRTEEKHGGQPAPEPA